MADERTVSTTDVVSYLDNGDPDYIYEIVDKTARANITSINTTLGKKRSIFYCDYFKFNNADTTKTKQRYQFVGPYHKMTNGAKTFTAANLIAGDVCFSTEIRAYDGTTVLRRGIFALEYNYKSSSKYYSPAAYTYGAVDFDFTDRLPQATSAANESVLAVNSSGDYYLDPDVIPILNQAVNDISDNTDAINNAQSDISTAQNDIETLQYDVDAVESSVENLESTVNTDISNIRDDISALDESVTELNGLTFDMRNATSSDYGKFLTYTSNDAWEAASIPTELPAVTSSDNGKVLKVVSGAWAKAAETKELPSVTTSDNNKVLKVVSGAWAKAAAPTELPAVTSSDNGKVLKVVSGAWAKAAETKELPTVTTSDAGNVLTVNSSGKWAKAAPPTELPAVTSSDEGKVLQVNSSGAWGAATAPTTPAQKLHYCGGFDKVSGVVSAIDLSSYETISNLAVDDLMYSYQFYDDTLNTNIPQKGFWISRITAISGSSITVDPIPFYSDTNTYSIERTLATVRQGIIKTSKVGSKALTSGLATDSIKIYSDDTGASGLDNFYYSWRGTYVNKTKTLNGIVVADGWVSYTTDIDPTTWEDVYTFIEHTGLYIGKVTTVELVNNVVCLTVTPLYTKEFPAVTSADEGKVLTVNSSGEWEAQTPSGGGASYNTVAQYYEEWGSNNLDVQFNSFITAIETAGDLPDRNTLSNYKVNIKGIDCEIIDYNSSNGKITRMDVGFKQYNSTNHNYDTIAFHYTYSNNTQTTTVYQTSYGTSGISISDIKYYGMYFTMCYYKLLKLG